MKQECRCGDNCRTCNTCEQPKCECYCEYYFEDMDEIPASGSNFKNKEDNFPD